MSLFICLLLVLLPCSEGFSPVTTVLLKDSLVSNYSFCIIHTRKAELRRAVEERRKRRHQDDVEGSYDDEKGKRRRTSSSNSQKSDKIDGHSSGKKKKSQITISKVEQMMVQW